MRIRPKWPGWPHICETKHENHGQSIKAVREKDKWTKSVTRPGWQHNHQYHIRQNEKLQSRGIRSPVMKIDILLQIGRMAKFIRLKGIEKNSSAWKELKKKIIRLKGIENECHQLSAPLSRSLRRSCWSFLHRIYSCLCIKYWQNCRQLVNSLHLPCYFRVSKKRYS